MAFSAATSRSSAALIVRFLLPGAADIAPLAGGGGAMGTLSTLGFLFPCGGALATR